jgi:hypothetical protein
MPVQINRTEPEAPFNVPIIVSVNSLLLKAVETAKDWSRNT